MPQVILVDDNIKALDGLRRHIPWHDTGCVCVGTAQNGIEALALCHALHPDVVITDVKMPQMDGIALCRQLHHSFPDMQIIVISAYDDFSFAQQAMSLGVKHYVLKPVNHQKIAELSAILLHMAQKTQQYTASMSAFFTSNDVDVLRQALLHTHEQQITQTITRIFASARLDVRVAKQIATHLVAVLYQHSSQFGLTTLVAHQSVNDGLAGIHALQTVESVRDYVFRMYHNVMRYLNAQRNPSTEQLVQRILHYIEEHYGDADISTYAIAQKFHLSQSYLCQIYREHTRTSIHATITQKRIDGACECLKQDPQRSIAEIGRQVGYMDAQYFAKVFRRVRGLTPSEYRELATPI